MFPRCDPGRTRGTSRNGCLVRGNVCRGPGEGGILGLLQVFSNNRLNRMHESIVQVGGVDMIISGDPNTVYVTNVHLRR
jgi:hypothetical protein